MMKKLAMLTCAVLIGSSVLAAGAAAPKTLTVKMNALNKSGENGTAILTDTPKGLNVVVKLVNGAKVAQPTHIHIGTCGKINKAPEYGLSSLVMGTSDTTVPGITIASLLKGHFAINVHKSADDLATYVSCGNIK